ncbi:cytochrome P450 2U1-like [Ptychodera flava]|uniref:cytochrome P450 2U1-like n=1 Tax=Ptychodera flava TaxID=63121 RepID=UPI003969D6C9
MLTHYFCQNVDCTTVLLATVVFVLVKVYLDRRTRARLPPGPLGLPVVGSLPFIVSHKGGAHRAMVQMAERYGDVFSVYFGSKLIVVLNGYRAVREALANRGDFFSDRPSLIVVDLLTGGKGIAEANGRNWREQRRFFLKSFRTLELGSSSRLEYRILEECRHLVSGIALLEGALFDPTDLLLNAVSNIICCVVFGKRFDYSDEKFLSLLQMLHELMQSVGNAAAIHFIPALKYVMRGTFKEIEQKRDRVFDFERTIVQEHLESLDPDNPRDFVDAYLLEMRKRKATGKESSFADDDYMVVTLSDLFTAGTETTSTTLKWGLLYLCLQTDVQQKAQEEIDRVVGSHRQTEMADQANLPYVQAVICEIQRMSSVFPFSVPHCSSAEAELFGYTIPKNTEILPNLWSVHHDSNVWKEPEKFIPERFLDETLEKVVKPEEFIPFGIGPRVCLGEQLGKMELFLFLSNMLQNFRFELDGDCIVDKITTPIEGLTLSPLPYKVRAIRRIL